VTMLPPIDDPEGQGEAGKLGQRGAAVRVPADQRSLAPSALMYRELSFSSS
jgi:hypothetical protein